MELFGNLFRKKTGESVVLIEIGANAVAGAFVRYDQGKLPKLVYTARNFLSQKTGETREAALSRGLKELGEVLIREGSPALARATGSGHIDHILASIATPWENTAIRIERLESQKPFTFTKSTLKDAVERSSAKVEGHILADEFVVATSLNGYVTHEPFGKSATRARIVILTASMNESIATLVATWLRGLFHTHAITITAFASIAYQSVHSLFPHEREYVLLEARGGSLSLMLIRHELLVATETLPDLEGKVADVLRAGLEKLATGNPLPPTIFLLADQLEGAGIRDALVTGHLETLWLGSNPPRIILVTGEHLSDKITLVPPATRDLFLSLMASTYTQRKP